VSAFQRIADTFQLYLLTANYIRASANGGF